MHCKDNFACVCVCDWAWFMLSIIHNAHRNSTLLFGQYVGHKITSRYTDGGYSNHVLNCVLLSPEKIGDAKNARVPRHPYTIATLLGGVLL